MYELRAYGVYLQGVGHIPPNPDNSDWQVYQAWRAEGNVPRAQHTSAELLSNAIAALKVRRDQLLRDSDWTQLDDAGTRLSGTKLQWSNYRQQLFDAVAAADPLTFDLDAWIKANKPRA